MGLRDSLRYLVYGPEPVTAKRIVGRRLSLDDEIDKLLHAREHPRSGAWRVPSVKEAMGVPPILRAVTLISSTTGMLSVQGFRNGAVMDDPPRLITRPDPFESPYTFYSGTAANLAKYGEYVWWIASRDSDGNPSALINVPLSELRVEDNPNDRLRPRYTWGKIESTRYSPANPRGNFVHRKYPLTEPFALRGEGPLQLAQAAMSISVEAQIWAANFYGQGGKPRDIIKKAGPLDPTRRGDDLEPDPDNGLSEAERLKAQYTARDNNTPMVIDDTIESITHPTIDMGAAQMLEARLHQRGDAALMFGIPGKFAEYVQSGSSLTYQNVEMAFRDLVKGCLQPLYLEPIEQDLSDLLTRTTSARFNVKGYLRADPKTRAEIYQILVPLGVMTVEQAQEEEGIVPGDVEYAPVPFAPPALVPSSVPKAASLREIRCNGCGRLLVKAEGRVEAICRHCKTLTAA